MILPLLYVYFSTCPGASVARWFVIPWERPCIMIFSIIYRWVSWSLLRHCFHGQLMSGKYDPRVLREHCPENVWTNSDRLWLIVLIRHRKRDIRSGELEFIFLFRPTFGGWSYELTPVTPAVFVMIFDRFSKTAPRIFPTFCMSVEDNRAKIIVIK